VFLRLKKSHFNSLNFSSSVSFLSVSRGEYNESGKRRFLIVLVFYAKILREEGVKFYMTVRGTALRGKIHRGASDTLVYTTGKYYFGNRVTPKKLVFFFLSVLTSTPCSSIKQFMVSHHGLVRKICSNFPAVWAGFNCVDSLWITTISRSYCFWRVAFVTCASCGNLPERNVKQLQYWVKKNITHLPYYFPWKYFRNSNNLLLNYPKYQWTSCLENSRVASSGSL